MFSTGQLIFAVSFLILFIVAVTMSYKKDKALHRKYYKGVFMVLVAFVLFLIALFFMKYLLKK